jgi:hypothetical protein
MDGDGGFSGGLNAEKYMKVTGALKATATRDLAHLVSQDLLWSAGQGKALSNHANVPGWAHGAGWSPLCPPGGSSDTGGPGKTEPEQETFGGAHFKQRQRGRTA